MSDGASPHNSSGRGMKKALSKRLGFGGTSEKAGARGQARMRLDLRFTSMPLDELPCQAVVAFVFQDGFIIDGSFSRLDVKLGGLVSRLERNRVLTGARGERLLVASQGMIRSDKVLFWGMGSSTDCTREVLALRMEELGEVLSKMRVNVFGLHVPQVGGKQEGASLRLENILPAVVKGCRKNPQRQPAGRIEIAVAVDRYFTRAYKEGFGHMGGLFPADLETIVHVEELEKEAMGH